MQDGGLNILYRNKIVFLNGIVCLIILRKLLAALAQSVACSPTTTMDPGLIPGKELVYFYYFQPSFYHLSTNRTQNY